MELLKNEQITYFEELLSFKTEKERKRYVDMLYKSYFDKYSGINIDKIRDDKNMIENFIEDCKEINECDYAIERFSLILRVI